MQLVRLVVERIILYVTCYKSHSGGMLGVVVTIIEVVNRRLNGLGCSFLKKQRGTLVDT